jgi:hypothetical protein
MLLKEQARVLVVRAWCWITRRDAVWVKTNSLKRVLWLCIAHPSRDPWKEETRPYVILDIGGPRYFFLNNDGRLSERVEERTKDDRVTFMEKTYADRWIHVSRSKRTEHTLKNG